MKLHLFLVVIVITVASIFVGTSSGYELIAAWPMDEGEGEEKFTTHQAMGTPGSSLVILSGMTGDSVRAYVFMAHPTISRFQTLTTN